jgi:hypothetical protein
MDELVLAYAITYIKARAVNIKLISSFDSPALHDAPKKSFIHLCYQSKKNYDYSWNKKGSISSGKK